MAETMRKELGDYMSTECFRYLRQGAEETAGRGLLVQAGRQRGFSLEDVVKNIPDGDLAGVTAALHRALGKDGTRLCLVDAITTTPGGYRVQISESACSAGLKTDTPNCAFTLGVFIGAMEVVSHKRLNGRETECVATGHEHCVYELEIL